MHITDKVALGDVRVTADGYLVTDARIARTGIQIYGGAEVGRPDLEAVRVFRAPEEVFAADTMASFAYRPVTNDHPVEAVSAANWKRYSVGMTGDQVARDGGFIRVPMTLMDQTAIKDVQDGKRELSCGYTCDLKFEPGTTPDGQAYDAIQTNIRGNHLAIVAAGRAGSDCRIGDEADKEKHMTLKTVTVDGIPVEVTDQGAAVINTLLARLADANKKLDDAAKSHADALAARDKELATKDAEIEKLKEDDDDEDDIDKKVEDRANLVAQARSIVGDLDTKGLKDADIRKAVVSKTLGDAAIAGKSEAYIDARFDMLVEDATAKGTIDPARAAIASGVISKDAAATSDKARDAYHQNLSDAWKGPKK